MPERTCPVCGNTFTPATANQRYCPPTPEDRARLKGQAVSRCAKRGSNHAQRTRAGRDTRPLTAPLPAAFDCQQCGKACEPGKDGVSAHAERFCGYDCKARWHQQHEDGATRRNAQARAHDAAVARLMTWPPHITRADRAEYRRALRLDPCAYCGTTPSGHDHIEPTSSTGHDDWTNLTGCCKRCNGAKGTLPLLLALLWLPTSRQYHDLRRILWRRPV